MVRSTTRIAHLRGVVELGPVTEPPKPRRLEKSPKDFVCLPANAYGMHKKLLDKLAAAAQYSDQSPFNTVGGPADAPYGVVTSGVGAAYVTDAVHDLGLEDKVAVFRVGFSYPSPTPLCSPSCAANKKFWWWKSWNPCWNSTSRRWPRKTA